MIYDYTLCEADKFIPCQGFLCCLTSITNPLEECKSADPRFPVGSNCICFCISVERLGECRPKAPKNEACISFNGNVKIVDFFPGCTNVGIDCCCDTRQALPCNDKLLPPLIGICCFVCLYKNQQKMLFGKKFSELDEVSAPTFNAVDTA